MEEAIRQFLLTEFIKNETVKHDFTDIGFYVEGKPGLADLVWKDKKVIVFDGQNDDSCSLEKDTNYKCYRIDTVNDAEALIKALM